MHVLDASEEHIIEFLAAHPSATATLANIANPDDVDTVFTELLSHYGRLTVLVNNAGVAGPTAPVEDTAIEEWAQCINVDLNGFFYVTRRAVPLLKEPPGASIINIASTAALHGYPLRSAYAASKFGGIGLVQSLALELAEDNIRVNAICPGNLLDSPLWTNSLYKLYAKNQGITEEEVRQKYIDQVPLKRGCSYEDVANMLVYLASEEATYMTGQAINITGGQQMT